MEKGKINRTEYVKQISKKSGYAQKDITEVLNVGREVLKNNLEKGYSTTVMDGMIVYPATYKHEDLEVTFARARFGAFFRNLDAAIL